MPTNQQLKIGASSFLNAAPLTYGFRHNRHALLVDDDPSGLAPRLRRGELDMALVPVVDVLFDPDLVAVTGLGVGADGPVRSVKLRCRIPLDAVKTVRFDPASNTSNCLARLLFRQHFRQPVRWLQADAVGHDAAVVIGDPALRDDPDCAEEYDLAGEWKACTGLPFVFAVWAHRRDTLDAGRLHTEALQSYTTGRLVMDTLVAEGARDLGLPVALVREYLGGALRYEHGRAEQTAMRTFKDMLEQEQIRPSPIAGNGK